MLFCFLFVGLLFSTMSGKGIQGRKYTQGWRHSAVSQTLAFGAYLLQM